MKHAKHEKRRDKTAAAYLPVLKRIFTALSTVQIGQEKKFTQQILSGKVH
jgi:hypothetical protein